MEFSSTTRERLQADERRVQTLVANVLKAVHEGTLHTDQAMIDSLGLEGVSPAVTIPYANDLLRMAVETFRVAKSSPELTKVAEGYALAATAFGHATQSTSIQGGDAIPSGLQNLKDRLSEYQQLAAHDDPNQRSLFEAASKVTLAAYGKPLAPAPEYLAEETTPLADGRKSRDGRFNKLATAGKLAAAIAGATVAIAGSAQVASAATQPTPEKPAPAPSDASSPVSVDLGTIAAKAEPQKYEASAKTAPAETSQQTGPEVPAKKSTQPASLDQSSSSRPAEASQALPSASTKEASPTDSSVAPQAQTDATLAPSPTEQASSQSIESSDKQPDAAPVVQRPHTSDQPSVAAATPDTPTSITGTTQPNQSVDVTKPASERQDDTHPVEPISSAQQKQEVPVIDVAQQVDLGSLGKAPTQDTSPDVHAATPAANTHVPIVKAQPFDTGLAVDLRDIEHAHPDSAPQPISLEKSDTESAPDLGEIAQTLKKATPQEYTSVVPTPAPAVPSPDQQPAPAPSKATPAPEAQKLSSEQQDYSTAAQKLIDQGGRWGRIGQAMKFFMEDPDLHFTPSQAAGFIGNLLGEGSELDPTMHQVGGPAFGIAQWEAGRLAALKQFGGDKYDQLDVQLQFIKHELLTSEQGSLSKLRGAANDRKAAASIAVKFYERPSVPREAERRAYADSVGDTFNAQYQQVTSFHNAAPAARMVVGTEIKTVFNQCDPAWGDIKVDGVRTCDMGCGPTDVAMVVNALAADTNITPKDVYEYVTQRGSWLAGGQGTSYDGVIDAAQHWGVKGYQLNNDALKNIDTYRSILSNGGLIMVAGKGPAGNAAASLPFVPGDVGAHFVIIRGMDQNGNFLITDSYPKTRDTNTTAWSANELMSKVFGAVAYTK